MLLPRFRQLQLLHCIPHRCKSLCIFHLGCSLVATSFELSCLIFAVEHGPLIADLQPAQSNSDCQVLCVMSDLTQADFFWFIVRPSSVITTKIPHIIEIVLSIVIRRSVTYLIIHPVHVSNYIFS